MNELLMDLNTEQQQVVSAPLGNFTRLAGAGGVKPAYSYIVSLG